MIRYTGLCVLLVSGAGCGAFGPFDAPDQSQFAPLDEVASADRPFVRLYGKGIEPIESIAIHMAFVFKQSGSGDLGLWELQPEENGPDGHIRFIDLSETERPEFFDTAFVVAEIFDDQAQSVAEFIQNQSPTYPCRNVYGVFGPNSNTYIGWALRQTGWNVTPPGRAIGWDAAVNCP
jgi:predicted small lipoprotein YifL